MHKVKDREVHKLKDKVSREVAKMYKDLEFSVIKVVGGEVRYCLGDDVEVGASGNHYPTFPQILLPMMSLSTLATSLMTLSFTLCTYMSMT